MLGFPPATEKVAMGRQHHVSAPAGAHHGSVGGMHRAVHRARSFNVGVVIAVAAFGAIVGDSAGYCLGRRYGYALLLRYGEGIGMFEARIKLGQYLFLKHGAKVVFLGRFVALLRMLAAFLAGVNRMPWRAFLTRSLPSRQART